MTLVRSVLAVGFAIGLMAGAAHAQTYPDRLVRILVPQGPGGPTDLLARVAAQRLQAVLHQNFIIENRGGAGGVIAAKAAGSAEPDGYTLFMGNTSVLVLIPILSRSAGYDPGKLFTPVARLAESYQVLVVNPSLPVKTVADLVAYAKANPGKLNYASAGHRQYDPSRRRAVQCRRRHQHRARALQLRRGSDHGGARRPGPDDVRQHHRDCRR